jgi:DNA-binding transcriptional regulator YhcF (GntR family)
MLKQLLSIIKEGEVHSVREMASELNISQDLVEQMLDDLVRKGYLRMQTQDCSELCQDCQLTQLCLKKENQSQKPSVWILTNTK